ncbi:MAG: hypothetical protein H6855_06510 [Rhodospirillales bacterium]|nr:hypothetical protein [Rhodospirillales bacterium]MCB9965715.1 hypothetical protein [Rhodospirillales bacterium]MCB9980082.1 hypothetical protein [Rhodospirillales bacterium]
MTQNDPQSLWVVFSGESEIRWINWFLKKGFRHCYALINDGSKWITYDPLAHKTDIAIHHQISANFDLPGWLQARGLAVVKISLPSFKQKALPPAFFTCVEAVKRLSGVRKLSILTPYQLFKELTTRAIHN